MSGSKRLRSGHFEWDTRIHDPYLHQNLKALMKKKEGGVAAMHYRKAGEEIYFLANLDPEPIRFKALLRSRSRNNTVALRWPGNGETLSVKGKALAGGRTVLDLNLPALESVLVVFKD